MFAFKANKGVIVLNYECSVRKSWSGIVPLPAKEKVSAYQCVRN